MFVFEKKKLSDINEEEFCDYEDKLIYQTPEWINFILDTQKVEPIILKIYENNNHIGYFTGFIFKKYGLKIIGSPFRGWTTAYMGFNIKNKYNIERAAIITPLWEYLRKEYGCVYLEIIDRFITCEDADKYNLTYELAESYGIDLECSADELIKRFKKSCRQNIRRFDKKGAKIIQSKLDDDFAELYYEQILKVFGYQGLKPSYDLKRVKVLLSNLEHYDRVLCIKAMDPNGNCIGTCISFGYNEFCYTWGSTSIRGDYDYKQSQALRWYTMMYWKDKGYTECDLLGKRGYKLQFSPYEISVPRIIMTNNKLLITGRNLAQRLYWKINAIKGKFNTNK